MPATLPPMDGIIRGRFIELDRDANLPNGQPVKVIVQPQAPAVNHPGEGLRRAFGTWTGDDAELDQFLSDVRKARRQRRPELEP